MSNAYRLNTAKKAKRKQRDFIYETNHLQVVRQ